MTNSQVANTEPMYWTKEKNLGQVEQDVGKQILGSGRQVHVQTSMVVLT